MASSLLSVATAFGALTLVLGLIWLAGRAARLGLPALSGKTASRGGRRLIVLETMALDRSRRLALVRCDAREMLLLTGGGNDVLIGWLNAPERPPPEPPIRGPRP